MTQQNKPTRTMPRQWEACCIILYASFGIGLLVEITITIPLGLVIGYTGSLLQDLIYFGAALLAIFVLSYRDGRQNYQFKLGRLLLCLLLTLATQAVLVSVIGHAVYLSGPTMSFAHRALDIYNPVSIPSKTVLEIYQWSFMIAAFLFIYTPTILLGEYLGAKKHDKEFDHKETDYVRADMESTSTDSIQP